MSVAVPLPDFVMHATLGDAAVAWAEAGWLVFPIVPRGKTPYTAGAFCGRTDDHSCGFRCATTVLDALRAWWDDHPDSNIGITAPDAFVIDEDRISALREAGLHLPLSPWQETGREGGGRHYFLTVPAAWAGLQPSARVRNRLENVEVKGFDKGYVIAAPSIHATGHRYELKHGGYMPEVPTGVANALTEVSFTDTTATGLSTITIGGYVLPASIDGGNRYHEIVRYTAHLYNRGFSPAEMWDSVQGQLAPRCHPPLSAVELRERFGRAISAMPERLGEPRALPAAERAEREEADALDFLEGSVTPPFPGDPDPAAFRGTLGEIVEQIADDSDASLVGILGSLIAFAGALFPGFAFYGSRDQMSAPFVALVGESSIGRKGTAMHAGRLAFATALDSVQVNRVMLDGIASGEGLITALHHKQEAYGKHEPISALLFEEEYASLLAARQREGSTLDPKMRQAFDGGPLSNNRSNRNDSKHVTDRHWLPALIGITPTELREKLEQGAFKSGSANRWLYLAVHKRDKETLHGRPNLEPDLVERIQGMRRRAVAHPPELQADPAVYTTLREYQAHLHESAHGIETDLTRRYSVIAFRIALVHALADGASAINTEHLERALALTEYGRASLPWIFGQSTGNDDADLLLRHLLARGRLGNHQITRHLIRDPNRKQRAIDILTAYGLAEISASRTTGRSRAELVARAPVGGFRPFRPTFLQSVTTNASDLDESQVASVDGSWSKGGQKVDVSWSEGPPKQASDRIYCRDYSGHQTSHRYTEGGWVCDICAPVGAS